MYFNIRDKTANSLINYCLLYTSCINIAKPGGTPTPVVRSGTVQIRKRLLDFLFGQQVNVLVLSPGDSVQTVEIRELKEGGKDRD